MPGAADHPKIPRIANTTIIGFTESDYDAGVFATELKGKELLTTTIEG
jgi:hypothetical protein